MTDATSIICEVAGCGRQAHVRLGVAENGHPPQESDLCRECAAEHSGRANGGVASLGIPAPTYGQPGIPIWPEYPNVIRRRSIAADRDDTAACRDL